MASAGGRLARGAARARPAGRARTRSRGRRGRRSARGRSAGPERGAADPLGPAHPRAPPRAGARARRRGADRSLLAASVAHRPLKPAVALLAERGDALGEVVAALQHRDRVDRVLGSAPRLRRPRNALAAASASGARAAICSASSLGRVEVLARGHDHVDEPGQPGLLRVEHRAGRGPGTSASAVRRGRGRAHEPRGPGTRPTAVSGVPKRAVSSATTMSQTSVSSQPPPSAWPWTRRDGRLRTLLDGAGAPQRLGARRRARSPAPPSSPKPAMSPPDREAAPLAVDHDRTRTGVVRLGAGNASRELAPKNSRVIAFSFSGRSIVSHATGGRTSERSIAPT